VLFFVLVIPDPQEHSVYLHICGATIEVLDIIGPCRSRG
jgi:hypothetical protein